MAIERQDVKRAIAVAALVLGITVLHYGTSPRALPWHVFYRDLYWLPILLAALWFGKAGGIITASVITALYAPHVAMSVHTPESTVGSVLGILFFYLFGIAVGSYADIRKGYQRTIHRVGHPLAPRPGRKVLVCVDESAASQQAAVYAGDLFGKDSEVSLTLLCAPAEPNPDFFSDATEVASEASRAATAAEDAIRRATSSLREQGIPEASLSTRTVAGGRLSEVILREQREGKYDIVVVGKHNLTRAQEFLFGNAAVRVAREAPCPVLIVGERDTTGIN